MLPLLVYYIKKTKKAEEKGKVIFTKKYIVKLGKISGKTY